MTKDTFSRIKPSVNLLGSPIISGYDFDVIVDAGEMSDAYIQLTNIENADWMILIYLSRPFSRGIMSVPDSKFFLLKTERLSGDDITFYFGSQYTAKFGVPAENDKIFIKLVAVATGTGQRVTLLKDSCLVEAA